MTNRARSVSPVALMATCLSCAIVPANPIDDKAIDVIDEAGAAEQLLAAEDREGRIDQVRVEEVISRMAGVPIKSVSSSDKIRLRELDAELQKRIFGQDEAIEKIVSAIKLSRAGLRGGQHAIGHLFIHTVL